MTRNLCTFKFVQLDELRVTGTVTVRAIHASFRGRGSLRRRLTGRIRGRWPLDSGLTIQVQVEQVEFAHASGLLVTEPEGGGRDTVTSHGAALTHKR